MDLVEAAAVAKCNHGMDACKNICAAKLIATVDGAPVAFADRRKQLTTDLEGFAWNNKAELFCEPKSQELNFGRLGFRLSKPTIEKLPVPKGEKKSVWDLVRAKIKAVLIVALCKLRLGCGKVTATTFSVSIEPNKNELLARFKAGDMNAAQLAKIGFAHKPECDEFFHEIEVKQVASHATNVEESESPAASSEAGAG